MIRIGGPGKIEPVSPSGGVGDRRRERPMPERKPRQTDEAPVEAPKPRRRPDPGTGEHVDIDV